MTKGRTRGTQMSQYCTVPKSSDQNCFLLAEANLEAAITPLKLQFCELLPMLALPTKKRASKGSCAV